LLGIAERKTEVSAALAALPIDQAAALVLVDALGYGVEEAARILDAPTGTVKSRCARGRARLAVTLGHLRPERNQSAPGTVGQSRAPGDEEVSPYDQPL
jgi:RNA polymerase sigma-70 factor (ECF subfamily)